MYDRASPTKIVEYLALGVPVVANDQPDQEKVINDSGAGICCDMDLSHVATAVETILMNAELSDRMRAAGPRYIATERSYDRIAGLVAETYWQYTVKSDGGSR
jgi:glycosyltransferase involved in cell wall biosynthesis